MILKYPSTTGLCFSCTLYKENMHFTYEFTSFIMCFFVFPRLSLSIKKLLYIVYPHTTWLFIFSFSTPKVKTRCLFPPPWKMSFKNHNSLDMVMNIVSKKLQNVLSQAAKFKIWADSIARFNEPSSDCFPSSIVFLYTNSVLFLSNSFAEKLFSFTCIYNLFVLFDFVYKPGHNLKHYDDMTFVDFLLCFQESYIPYTKST